MSRQARGSNPQCEVERKAFVMEYRRGNPPAGTVSLQELRARNVAPTVVTLGPTASDSAYVARQISAEVILAQSFPEAMRTALETQNSALICCGYKDERLTWVDLHFQYLSRMECYEVFLAPTMPMALAKHRESTGTSVALHPATAALLRHGPFARHLSAECIEHMVVSKPRGVTAAAKGECDYCIGSVPNIENHPTLEVLDVLQVNMAWALYRPVSS